MVARLGRALRHRNFRLFFTGQGISLIGTWLTKVATSWLVYRLTGSAWLLGRGRIRGPDPHVPPRPACRRPGRSLEPAPRPPRHPDARDAPVGPARGACARRLHPGLGGHRAQRVPGPRRRVRHARAPVDAGADGGRSRGSAQRDRPQLLDGERRAPARAGCRRRGHRRRRRGVVLLRRRHQLRRRHPLRVPHARRHAAARAQDHARAPRDGRGIPLRERLRAHPRAAAPPGRVGHRRETVRGAPPGHRARGDARRRGDAGRPPGDGRLGRARGRALPRLAHERPRAGAGGRGLGGALRLRPGGLLAGARALARDAAAAPRGHRDDAADGGEQHHHPDHRRRGQARPGDEPPRDVALRDRASREPDRGRARDPHRRREHDPRRAERSASSPRGSFSGRSPRSAGRCGQSTNAWESCRRPRRSPKSLRTADGHGHRRESSNGAIRTGAARRLPARRSQPSSDQEKVRLR